LRTISASNLFLLHEPASSGERVSEETAWRLVPVYRAVTMISNDIGRMPFHAAIREADGDLVPVESTAVDLLSDSPHRYMGSMEFRRTLTGQALRYGNAFAFIVRNGRGDVLELVPMLPGEVQLHSRVTGDLTELYYTHHREGRLDPADVLHIKAPGNDGLWGESPIKSARESLGLMRAMEKAGGKLYAQSGIPKLALVHPGPLSAGAIQSIGDSYAEKHSGADNAGRPLILGEGMKVEKLNQSLEDQMWIQAREFSVQEVSRLFGVPTVYLAEHSRSTFASITELTRTYWDGCLAHWTSVWSEEVRRKLLPPGQHMVWDTRDLLKGSFSDQVQSLRSAVESGILTRNEARQRLGLQTLPGLDEPLTPENTRVEGADA